MSTDRPAMRKRRICSAEVGWASGSWRGVSPKGSCSGPHPVQLSQSWCSDALYKVNVFLAAMIVCRATRLQRCQDGAALAQLHANVVYVPVLRPC